MARSLFLESDNPVDFLYLDRQRVSSLIGQLSDRGMLTGYKSSVGKASSVEGHVEASAVLAKAEGKKGRVSSESAEETYDPFWTHVYSFIQDLEANFAVPLERGRIGSLVKFEGFVQFLDLGLLRNLWEPSAKIVSEAVTPGSELTNEQKFGAQFLKEFPHLFHLTFLARGGFRLWAAVQPANLTISSADLTMKYGAVMDGIWTSIGIVDGGIGPQPDPLPVNDTLDGVVKAMTLLRQFVGRPQDHFGFTPLAIYSPIHGIAEAEAEMAPSEPSAT
jgi:hypothetical protein